MRIRSALAEIDHCYSRKAILLHNSKGSTGAAETIFSYLPIRMQNIPPLTLKNPSEQSIDNSDGKDGQVLLQHHDIR